MRIETIKKRSDFLTISAKGKKFIVGTLILQSITRPEGHPAGPSWRIGYTVTKKMGNAVARNRIKRRLREATRKVAPPLARDGHDYVIISRHKAIGCEFSDLLRDMEFAFSRIPSMKNNAPDKRHANERPETRNENP